MDDLSSLILRFWESEIEYDYISFSEKMQVVFLIFFNFESKVKPAPESRGWSYYLK